MDLEFKVVGRDPDPARKIACKRMLVGPWCNQPEQYEGYYGFVGWASLTVLRSGRWLTVFNSVLLDGGTVYVIYQHNNGTQTHDARTGALWGIRVGVADSADGIEILPAPGSPADIGFQEAYTQWVTGGAGVAG